MLCALDRLGDALDAAQSGIPRVGDGGELRHSAGKLGIVDAVVLLAAGGCRPHEAGAVEHGEVLRHRLPRDGQLLAERGGGAMSSADLAYG